MGATGQLEDCRKLAADRGWSVGDEYVDNDVSAFSGNRRRDYERMLADLGSGARNAVIVYNLDRLHRRPAELEEFVTLCERAGADAAGAADPESDPAQTVSASDRARKSWLAAESRRTDSRDYCPHWRRRPYYAASKTPTATPSCCVWPSMMPVNIGARFGRPGTTRADAAADGERSSGSAASSARQPRHLRELPSARPPPGPVAVELAGLAFPRWP